MKPLNGKVALITGASAPRGIGRAIATRLAKDGASVVVTDIAGSVKIEGEQLERTELLNTLAQEIKSAGGKALALTLDVTNAKNIQTSLKATLGKLGRIDILVNNAGSLAGSDNFLSTTPEQWESSFQVNILRMTSFTVL